MKQDNIILKQDILIKEWELASKYLGKVLVISGPQSSGKTTLIASMLKYFPNCTTINRQAIIYEVTADFYKFFFKKIESLVDQPISSFLHLKSIKIESLHPESQQQFKEIKEKLYEFIAETKAEYLLSVFSNNYADSIKKNIYSGKDTLIDEGLLRYEEDYNIFRYSLGEYSQIKTALLFTSLEGLANNCISRNQQFSQLALQYSNIDEAIKAMEQQEISSGSSSGSYRFPKDILRNYRIFYELTSAVLDNQNLLEELNKENLNPILDMLRQEEGKLNTLLFANAQIPSLFYEEGSELEELSQGLRQNLHVYAKATFDYVVKSENITSLDLLNDKAFLESYLEDILHWFNNIENHYSNDLENSSSLIGVHESGI